MSAGIGLALGSAVCFAALTLTQRIVARESNNPRATAFWFNGWAILISVGIFILSGRRAEPVNPAGVTAYLFLAVAMAAYGVFERMRYTVARDLEASVWTIIANIASVTAFLGSLVWYGEEITRNRTGGAMLILGALILVSVPGRIKVKPGPVVRGIVMMAVLGLAFSLDKMGAANFGAETYNLLMWGLPMAAIVFPWFKKEELTGEWRRSGKILPLLAGFNVGGTYLLLQALAVERATVVIPVGQMSTLMVVLAGVVWLKERDNLGRKLLAGMLAVAGVGLLAG